MASGGTSGQGKGGGGAALEAQHCHHSLAACLVWKGWAATSQGWQMQALGVFFECKCSPTGGRRSAWHLQGQQPSTMLCLWYRFAAASALVSLTGQTCAMVFIHKGAHHAFSTCMHVQNACAAQADGLFRCQTAVKQHYNKSNDAQGAEGGGAHGTVMTGSGSVTTSEMEPPADVDICSGAGLAYHGCRPIYCR